MSDKFDREWLETEAMLCYAMDSFPEYVLYLQPFKKSTWKAGKPKLWIVQLEDLKVMYESFNPGDIKLWCESKAKEKGHGKRDNENKEELRA